MDLPASPDHLLTSPTRRRLFSLLADLRRPSSTDELAERLELHPNGVRAQLARLERSGLVSRERIRHGRGRPRDYWTIAPDARPGGEPPTGYAELGGWLARAVAGARVSLRRVEATGRAIGRELAPVGPGSTEEKLRAALVAMGFAPQRQSDAPNELVYRLCNCPYRDTVRKHPELVCAMHRGITRGLLDGLAPDTRLAAFVPSDPDSAGCLIRLRGGLAPR
jgi:predicted ArsR family transcriptional regulator